MNCDKFICEYLCLQAYIQILRMQKSPSNICGFIEYKVLCIHMFQEFNRRQKQCKIVINNTHNEQKKNKEKIRE